MATEGGTSAAGASKPAEQAADGDGVPSLLAPPATSQATASLDLRTSDSAIISHWPTSLLRLVVLLAPFVRASTRLVRLVTWTGGPGTGSHSLIVVLSWWAVCLYGYELLRYAPQLALLGILIFTGLNRAMQAHTKSVPQGRRAATADSINATVEDLAVLADFCSAVWTNIGGPVMALLSWHDTTQTIGLAVFAVTSWPVWLLLFSGSLGHAWDILGLKAKSARVLVLGHYLKPFGRYVWSMMESNLQTRFPSIWATLNHAFASAAAFARTHVFPAIRAGYAAICAATPPSLRSAPGPHFGVFPILSLRIRHLLLIVGTIALTWCAPWAALVRHSLWRSAFVRHMSRTLWSIFSGQILFGGGTQGSHAYVGRLEDSFDSFAHEEGLSSTTRDGKKKSAQMSNGKISRHEDVIYQFSIFENQRWWMGLDWTAALLPQERPSWADESHNPVSPPSSFSLPPPKTTITASPSSSDSKRYTKRLIRWQWIDTDWKVAGRDGRANPTLSSSSSSAAGGSVNDETGSVSGLSALSSPTEDPSWKDVDAEGWQYGDNGWDKMSKKGGMGRYTRRRRWVRRAVLTEVVQSDYQPSPAELAEASAHDGDTSAANGDAAILAAAQSSADALGKMQNAEIPALGNGSLRERLNRVAGKQEAAET